MIKKILLLEDSPIKGFEVTKVLRNSGVEEVICVKNLKHGLDIVFKPDNGVELIVTDMYYPIEQGSGEARSGEMLIERLAEANIKLPVIVCSSANCRIAGIVGCVHYSPNEDWERELERMLKGIDIQTAERRLLQVSISRKNGIPDI